MLGAPAGRFLRSTLSGARKLNSTVGHSAKAPGPRTATAPLLLSDKLNISSRHSDTRSIQKRLYSSAQNTQKPDEAMTQTDPNAAEAAPNASAAASNAHNQSSVEQTKTPTHDAEATAQQEQKSQQSSAEQTAGAAEGAKEEEKTEQKTTSWPEESDWPPVHPLSTPWFAFSGAVTFAFLYLWFAVTDEKFLDVIDFLEGGAGPDRLLQLRRIKRWLLYEGLGVEITRKLSTNGIIQAILAAHSDKSLEVRRSVEETLCELSKYEKTRQALVQANVVDLLRKSISRDNYDAAWTLANVSQDPLAAAQIARDDYIIECMLDILESTQEHIKFSDYVTLRAIFTTLANVTQDASNIDAMTVNMKDKLSAALTRMYPVDPIIVKNFVNTRGRVAKARPDDYPDVVQAVQVGVEETDGSLWKVGLVHHALITLVAGGAWSWHKVRQLSKKYAPLKISERHWLRRMMWRSPLAAVAMSFTWMGLTHVSRYVSGLLDWEERNAPRKAFLPYLVQIPAYFFAMKLAPFVLIPSLIQFQWREDGPPRYMAVGRMLDQFMTDLGIFDPYYHDELNNPAAYKDEPAEETKAFIKESVKAVEGLIEASEKQKQRSPRRWL